jgi:hypothetical protein
MHREVDNGGCVNRMGHDLVVSCRFGGRRITAVEDDGLVNYAAIDAADEERRLENFGAELEAD